MLEALLYAAPDALRERAPELLARVRPGQHVERLGYLIAMTADDAVILDAVVALARRCTPPLDGVIAAATARRLTAEQLCDRVAGVAAAIPDAHLVRLVLRERLATVADPARRLELLDHAIASAPALEGLAHDHLQLLHLVAKRAVAPMGDAAAARTSWQACLSRDRDNLAAVENLARLAAAAGEAAPELAPQIAALRAVYAAYSPRAELVMLRAGAELVGGVAHALTLPVAATDTPRLVHAAARGPRVVPAGARWRGPCGGVCDRREAARRELGRVRRRRRRARPAAAHRAATQHALIGIAKDAAHDDVAAGYADARGNAPGDAWRAHLAREVEPLLDPETRADYDARTAEAPSSAS